MRSRNRFALVSVAALTILLLAASPALAYVGPGAGLELVGYFMALLATVGVAFLSIFLYPFYALIRFLRGDASPSGAASAPVGNSTTLTDAGVAAESRPEA